MRVDQLWRFPVKSMRGERRDELEIDERGVVGDRGYALVDPSDGKIVSAKNPRKWRRVLELAATYVDEPVSGGAVPPVRIDLPDGTSLRSDGDATEVDRALTAFLGREVHLTSDPPPTVTMEEVWPAIEGLAPEEFIASTRIESDAPDEVVSDIRMAMDAPPGTFFDVATLHLLTTSTLAALGAAYPEGHFDVRRYRPNLLVATDDDGYVENAWAGGRVVTLGDGGAAMRTSFPTMRCIMTTLAQEDLPTEPGLLRTIAAENRLDLGGGGRWACAGVYGGVAGTGRVRVGDPVSVSV